LEKLPALAFWALHVGPLIALLAIAQIVLGKFSAMARRPVLVQLLLAAVVASLLFSPLALLVDALFQAEGSVDDDGESLVFEAFSEIAHYFIPASLTWLLINASSLRKLPHAETKELAAEALAQVDAPESDFWARMPGRLGRNIVAMSAELHYLRVHTTQGDALILFPFGQAVALLDSKNGMQIHRSHWVSLSHVDELTSDNGRVFCKTIGGPTLPVSRSYRSSLRNALKDNGRN
jgi:hypothetical protein